MRKVFALVFSALFSINASASLQDELKIMNTFLANPDVGQKLYGDRRFKVLDGGLTTYSQIVLGQDYYHIVGVPHGLYSFNNMFISHFQLHDVGHLNVSIPKIVAEEWVKKSVNGKYELLIVEGNDSFNVYFQSYEPIENLLNPTSNYKNADVLELN